MTACFWAKNWAQNILKIKQECSSLAHDLWWYESWTVKEERITYLLSTRFSITKAVDFHCFRLWLWGFRWFIWLWPNEAEDYRQEYGAIEHTKQYDQQKDLEREANHFSFTCSQFLLFNPSHIQINFKCHTELCFYTWDVKSCIIGLDIIWYYKGVSKSFWTSCLEWELHMVQLSATGYIAILWVSLWDMPP